MKKIALVAVMGTTLIVSGCVSTGGLTASNDASNGGCNAGVAGTAGALVGALAGYAISHKIGNSSAQNNRAIAIGAALGGAVSAGACLIFNAQTVQKRTASDVENQYRIQNGGALPNQTSLQQYTTVLNPGNIVRTNSAVESQSDLVVIQGQAQPLTTLQETLVLRSPDGTPLKTSTKNVTQTAGTYGSGEFGNTFKWQFPANAPKGIYTVETNILINGKKVSQNVNTINLV